MSLDKIIEEFEPSYLGDSVYVKFDGYAFVLYLDNGYGAHTEIVLEPDVYQNLINYADRVAEHIKSIRG